jgi:hypothetical protein
VGYLRDWLNNEGMARQHKKTSVQYTLLDVLARVDQALRHIAEETDRSLNEVAKEALTQWVNLPSEDPQDLNSFFGSWIEDSEVDVALSEQRQIDEKLWR